MTGKPKLLVLASTYPRWANDHEPGFVHELSRRLTNHFNVRVLTPHHQGALRRERRDGVEIRRYCYAPERLQTLIYDGGMVTNLRRNQLKCLLLPMFFLAQLTATWRQVRRWQPDMIHAHWLIPQGLVAALLSKLVRKFPPFLVTSHGADLHALRFWPMPALKRFVARRAAGLAVVSSSMLEVLEQQGIASQGVHVQPMGVDLQTRFVPDPSVVRSDSEILFVGRLVEKKGLRYLLEALPAIIQAHPGAHLTIAGYGPEQPKLEAQAAALGIADRVTFLGAVPQDQLPNLYRRAAVFVAPFVQARGGDQEGLGLVTVEAIGCGCPVIVSDLPAVRDVVDNPDMRVAPGDASALAAAVRRLLQLSPENRMALAAEWRSSLFQRFDWSQRAKAYAGILLGLNPPVETSG